MNWYQRAAEQELMRTLDAVLRGAPITLEVCRDILGGCATVDVPDDMSSTLVVVESQLDDVPGLAQRELWNRDLYERLRTKAEEFLLLHRRELLTEFRALHEFLVERGEEDSPLDRSL